MNSVGKPSIPSGRAGRPGRDNAGLGDLAQPSAETFGPKTDQYAARLADNLSLLQELGVLKSIIPRAVARFGLAASGLFATIEQQLNLIRALVNLSPAANQKVIATQENATFQRSSDIQLGFVAHECVKISLSPSSAEKPKLPFVLQCFETSEAETQKQMLSIPGHVFRGISDFIPAHEVDPVSLVTAA